MGLFKSKEEKRIERELAVRKAKATLDRQIQKQDRHEKDWLRKAVRAKRIGDERMLKTILGQVKRTQLIRSRLERSLLALETAVQAKDQIESMGVFGEAMTAVSTSIEKAYGVKNLVKSQAEYELAMTKAKGLEARIDLFLEGSFDVMTELELGEDDSSLTDQDLERLIAEAASEEEAVTGMDDQIERGLREIEEELSKGK